MRTELENLFRALPVIDGQKDTIPERVNILLLTNEAFLKRKRGQLPKDKKRLDVIKDINKKAMELQNLIDNSPEEWRELLDFKSLRAGNHRRVKEISYDLKTLVTISEAVIKDIKVKKPKKQMDPHVDAITGEAAKHYIELTGKNITTSYDSELAESRGKWTNFLKNIFRILDIKDSPESRAKTKVEFINSQLK